MSKAKKITILGLLTAVAIVGRTALQGIPNVQPATFLIIATGIVYGWKMGSLLGVLIAFVTGLLTGIGSWTPFQMAAWGMVGLISGFVPRKFIPLTVWSFASAFVYGFISSLSMLIFIPLNAFIPTYVSGLPFDLYHAIGNIAFVAFAPLLFKVFEKYNK